MLDRTFRPISESLVLLTLRSNARSCYDECFCLSHDFGFVRFIVAKPCGSVAGDKISTLGSKNEESRLASTSMRSEGNLMRQKYGEKSALNWDLLKLLAATPGYYTETDGRKAFHRFQPAG